MIIAGLALMSVSSCGLLSKKYTKTKTDEFKLNTAGKKKIMLDNVSGSVTITHGSDSNAIIIKAVK